MPLHILNCGNQLSRIADEHFPTSLTPWRWHISLLIRIGLHRMAPRRLESLARTSLELSHHFFDQLVAPTHYRMGMIVLHKKRMNENITFLASSANSLPDDLLLPI